MITEAIRNYEVSIWTLLDEFITVLKWSNLEQKGEIENPKFILDVDGTLNFTFSVPMYLYQDGKLVENPIWYNTRNGNLAVDMRKIKVIFNKNILDVDNVDWPNIFNKVYVPRGYKGNVNLFKRPIISLGALAAVGYTTDNNYESICPTIHTVTKSNKQYDLIYTPICEDGTIMNNSAILAYLIPIVATHNDPNDWLVEDADANRLLLAVRPHSENNVEFCQLLLLLLDEWNSIRAVNNWFGYTPYNPSNVILSEPNYIYYLKYLCSINTFEFLITKINETHEKDILTCEVTCEGFAFHELGKRGYIYDLSNADFELEYKNWQDAGAIADKLPKENVLFWCEKIGLKPVPMIESEIDPSLWYYEILMNYDSYAENSRLIDCVYEDPFPTNWNYDEGMGKLIPQSFLTTREKERAIEVKESNIYNITLAIAEKFEIYCRYEYGHDMNYNIISRKVVFFNNFLHDSNIMSITYPYSSSKITREMEGTNITTKLFVRPSEDYSTLMGEMNIRFCDANKTQEDYILNFDYLKETGNLTDELILEITEFEEAMHILNNALYPLENKINVYTTELTELKAKITYYTESIKLDKELYDINYDYIRLLTMGDGIINEYIDSYDASNPQYTIITTDSLGTYCINLKDKKKGIHTDSIKIYRTYNTGNHTLSNQITNYSVEYDEYGNPIRIYGIAPTSNSSAVYMTYLYEPRLYYEAIANTWQEKINNDTVLLEEVLISLDETTLLLEEAQEEYEEVLAQKRETMLKFEKLMGPALREGYWQPEDYKDYGELYEKTKVLTNTYNQEIISADTGSSFNVYWDDQLFDEEQDLFYYSGINSNRIIYPIVNLSRFSSDSIINNINEYSFVFNNNYYSTLPYLDALRYTRSFSVGSEAIPAFVRTPADDIIPVLILVGAKNMTDEQIAFMLDTTKGHPRLTKIVPSINNDNKTISTTGGRDLTDDDFIIDALFENSESMVVYPRIKFSSLMLKTSEDSLYIRYDNTLLKNYEDYYIRTRHIQSGTYAPEYLITIKPIVVVKKVSLNKNVRINYILSNANTSIYVDALKVSEENAYPKVSYTVDPNILDRKLLRNLLNKLNWLVMINDVQLKFKNVFGYISRLELDLDFPDNDSIEIKNYKTKFEDLFSTIVALTEAMKQNTGLFSSLAGGTYNLSDEGLSSTLINNSTVVNEYLDEYINNSEAVKKMLSALFNEAGNILSDANNTLNLNLSLSLANSQILSGFATTILKELVPHVFRQINEPNLFNKGDIWIEINASNQEVARYIATSDSSNSSGEKGGWIKTYNGSLALINGASMNIDTVAGNIEIFAGNTIDIAAGEIVNITGNKEVNIGGVTINIGSVSALDSPGGINLVSAAINSNNFEDLLVSKVLIHPDLISMYGSKIDMAIAKTVNGVSTAVSALTLDPDEGIWLGSSKKISLFADNNNGSTANVEISPAHIFFGMNNTSNSNATAMELTEDYIILAAGNSVNSIATTSGGITINNNLAGVEIKKDKIALAIGSSTNRAIMLMNNDGITVGSGADPMNSTSGGSYVSISGAGVTIGSKGHLNVNTNNCIISSNASGSNPIFFVGSGTGTNDKYIRYLANGTLEIKGSVVATTFVLGSDGHSLTTTDISGFDSAVTTIALSEALAAVNNASFGIDGLTTLNTRKMNSTDSTTVKSVELTSLTKLVLGANEGIYVAPTANSALNDSTVIINSEKINLHYSNDNYIHLSNNGVEVKGTTIKMEDVSGQLKSIWGRNDIVVMNPNISSDSADYWRHSVESIEETMVDENDEKLHDWVLIRPYYNAIIKYSPNSGYFNLGRTTGRYTTMMQESGNALAFGNNASWYKYHIAGHIKNNTGSYQRFITTAYLSNTPITSRTEMQNTDVKVAIPIDISISQSGDPTYEFETTQSGQNAINLCTENATVYLYIDLDNSIDMNMYLQLTCSCDATTSKVPCTIYYYP